MRRSRMGYSHSRNDFKRKSAAHPRNFGMPMRGGWRL